MAIPSGTTSSARASAGPPPSSPSSDRRHGGCLRGDASPGPRLQGHRDVLGPAAERDRAARRVGQRDDEHRDTRRRARDRGRATGRAHRERASGEPGGGGDRTHPLRETGTDANVWCVASSAVLSVRDNVKLVEGRFLQPGLAEAVIGKGARIAYAGLDSSDGPDGSGNLEIVGSSTARAPRSTPRCGRTARCSTASTSGRRTSFSRDGAPEVGGRFRRVRGDPQGRPAAERAGPARAGVLREAVAAHHTVITAVAA